MFDSPFGFCEVCKQYVLLDQTKRECASSTIVMLRCARSSRVFPADHQLLAEVGTRVRTRRNEPS